jgi:radical SAM-linked protein
VNTAPDGSNGLPGAPPVLPREAAQRWRLELARDAIPADAAQREQLAAWEAALVASGLPLAGLDGDRPRPRFAPAAPLAASVPGEAELIDLWLVERLPAWRVREALRAVTPPGWHLVAAYDVWLGEPALPGRVAASVYRATLAPGVVAPARLAAAARELLGEGSLPRSRRKGETTVTYDLRPFLDGLEVLGAPDGGVTVRMTLRHDPEKGVGRPEEALAALAERSGVPLEPVTLVRERLVLADPAAAAAASRRRPMPGPATGRGPRPPSDR